MSTSQLVSVVAGFEHIHRRFDGKAGEIVATLNPGDYFVTEEPEKVTTLLGSCIAACIRDRDTGVGGMNHFLLPEQANSDLGALTEARYGSYAMEAVINGIMRLGGERSRLEVKLFGGARMIEGLSDVGQRNIEFALAYFQTEGIQVVAQDLGGDRGRVVHYWPVSGRARLKHLRSMQRVRQAEVSYRQEISKKPSAGSVELF